MLLWIGIACLNLLQAQGSFSLVAPTNGQYTHITPYFDWENSSGATYYRLFVDGIIKKDNITTSSYQLLSSESLTQGLHTWYVEAIGGGTTASNETWSLYVDLNAPAAFSLISPLHNSWNSNLNPTFTWSASLDAQSGLAKYQLWIDGVLKRDNIPAGSTFTTSSTPLSNGNHSWYIKAIDNVGNTRNSTETWTIKTDYYPPSLNTNYALLTSNGYASVWDYSAFNMQDPQYLTIEAWVNLNSNSNRCVIVSKGKGCCNNMPYQFGIHTSGQLYFHCYYLYQGHDTYGPYYNVSGWNHVALVISGGFATFYINGVANGGYGVYQYLYNKNNDESVYIGKDGWNGPNFDGFIDEVRIWSIARTDSEIFNYMNVSLSGNEPGLAGYWRFNEGSGSQILDRSVQQHHGNLSGAVYVTSPLTHLSDLCILKSPTSSQYVPSQSPAFSWGTTTDAGIGFQKFQLWVDGVLKADNLSDSSFTISDILPYGSHNWYVKGFDSLGNCQASKTQRFYIDNARPLGFNLTSPTNYQIVNLPTPNLSWQSTSDSANGSGMRKYQLWINNIKNRDSIPIGQTTVAPSGILPQGIHNWCIKAIDNAGNARQSNQSWSFYVDWEPPLPFSLITPENNESIMEGNTHFEWQAATDLGSGIDRYELIISGQDIIQLPDSVHEYTLNLPVGDYSWYIKAFDKANTFTSSDIQYFSIIPSPFANLTGTITYDNFAASPMSNIQISLVSDNEIIAQTTSGLNGAFSFNNLPPATYVVSYQTTKNTGGINATDALAVLKHFVEAELLSGLKQISANVNADNTINSIDAFLIGKRYVELIDTFPAGDWLFGTGLFDLNLSGNYNINIKGLCYGDVNGSFVPDP